MTIEGLLAESAAVNNFRFRQVERQPQGAIKAKGAQESTKVNATQDLVNDPILSDIVKARQKIQLSLASSGDAGAAAPSERVQKLEARVSELEEVVKKLTALVDKLSLTPQAAAAPSPAKPAAAPTPAKPVKAAVKVEEDDDDVDLFGSDDDDAEADAERKQRLEAYAAKKAKKPGPIAKSSVILDVKPWDDETDMSELEKSVRTIEMDGLVWGASKLVPLAYGIKKLQIICVVEDEKVSIEELTEKIEAFEDYVQSVDIAAFNKI